MNRSRCFYGLAILGLTAAAHADLLNLADNELSGISAQAGLSLDAAVILNTNQADTRCPDGCGLRLAVKPGDSPGFLVLDNLKGAFSFDGITIDVVQLSAAHDTPLSVLRLGMEHITSSDVQYTLGVSNQAIPGNDHRQSDFLTFKTSGTTSSSANIHVFGLSR